MLRQSVGIYNFGERKIDFCLTCTNSRSIGLRLAISYYEAQLPRERTAQQTSLEEKKQAFISAVNELKITVSEQRAFDGNGSDKLTSVSLRMIWELGVTFSASNFQELSTLLLNSEAADIRIFLTDCRNNILESISIIEHWITLLTTLSPKNSEAFHQSLIVALLDKFNSNRDREELFTALTRLPPEKTTIFFNCLNNTALQGLIYNIPSKFLFVIGALDYERRKEFYNQICQVNPGFINEMTSEELRRLVGCYLPEKVGLFTKAQYLGRVFDPISSKEKKCAVAKELINVSLANSDRGIASAINDINSALYNALNTHMGRIKFTFRGPAGFFRDETQSLQQAQLCFSPSRLSV